MLNGRVGVVLQYIEAAGRYEVQFGPEQIALLRPDKLRRCKDAAAGTGEQRLQPEPPPAATPEKPKPMSLASLLGLGAAKEEPKQPQQPVWQSVWERTALAAGAPACAIAAPANSALDEDQLRALRTMHDGEESRTRELEALRAKVAAEFSEAGISDESMIEEAFQQQLQEYDFQKLLRPQSFTEEPGCGSAAAAAATAELKKRRHSRSSSSSSSSRSSGRRRRRSRSPRKPGAEGGQA